MTSTETPNTAAAPTPALPIQPQPLTGVQQRAEWAIELPDGKWWRKLSLRLIDPDGTGPSVFHIKGRAADELVDVIGQVTDDYGVIEGEYRPRLMVRNIQISATGVTTGPWRPASSLPTSSSSEAVR
ncbi:hypothetical protein [Nocardia testacea]|uniref:hypothetical protein n=1 Tax=Nocardia testacea TaxID=248551 RepID=UPI0033CE4B69